MSTLYKKHFREGVEAFTLTLWPKFLLNQFCMSGLKRDENKITPRPYGSCPLKSDFIALFFDWNEGMADLKIEIGGD